MKIGVSSTGKSLNDLIDPRFGRCGYFLIVDTEILHFEVICNESAMASGGAGIQAAQIVANTGVKAVITGNIGPNAFQTLSAAKIAVFTGANGTVIEAIKKWKSGDLILSSAPNVGSHSGMKATGKGFMRG